MVKDTKREDLVTYCKRKGFAYQSSEIYGGLTGVWDFGHLGKLLKNNLESVWKKYFLSLGDNFHEIEGSFIMPKDVFVASGHIDNFDDPLAECFNCGNAQRADKIIEEQLGLRVEGESDESLLKILNENHIVCSKCKKEFSKVSRFNMMFPFTFGPKGGQTVYLRPETAQTPYLNFKVQHELLRKKMPLGLAVIGRAFRNEISPKHSLIRCREFEQAELQVFFNPKNIDNEQINDFATFSDVKDEKLKVMLQNERDKDCKEMSAQELIDYGLTKFYVYHMVKVQNFILNVLGVEKENFRLYELNDDEKAFYNKSHFDIEVYSKELEDWIEVGGVHYRTDHDLGGHQKVSKTSLEVKDEESGENYVPHVLELSFGHWRLFYTLLDQNLGFDEKRENNVLSLQNKLAPYKVALFPLMNKPELVKVARELFDDFTEEDINVIYDKSGSIGKRYARQDEVGTPYCITVDYETLEDGENKGSVTIRDRDSTEQKRIPLETASGIVLSLIKGKIKFSDL